MAKINARALGSPSEVSVDAFLYTSLAIGRFMRVCSSLPSFTDKFTFLHCLIVFAIGKEPTGLPLTVLCRQIGLSSDDGQEVVRQLEVDGLVKVTVNGIQVTDAGFVRLTEVNRQLLPHVQTALENPDRLRNLVRLLRYIMRAWSKGSSSAHDGSGGAPPTDDFEAEQIPSERPYRAHQPLPASLEEAPQAQQAIPTSGMGDRIWSVDKWLFRSGKESGRDS